MCQNWYSVTGQVLDIMGFLTIAWEWWRYAYRDLGADIAGQIEVMLERRQAEHEERAYEDTRGFELHSRHVQQEYWKEYFRRGRIFAVGATLVIFGFVFQVLGNIPHLFKSC